jgi:hypothetical protein
MNLSFLLQKISYYADTLLHLRIIREMAVISLYRGKGYHCAVPDSVVPHPKAADPAYLFRLRRYCALWLAIRNRLGFHDRCYYRSALTCRVLRQSGIDARLNFGTMKGDASAADDWHFTGHCWVSYGTEVLETAYPFVIQYPSKGMV